MLLFRVYPGLQQLSPLVTVEEILAELEDSFGEVVKFLDEAVLDLESKIRALYESYQWKWPLLSASHTLYFAFWKELFLLTWNGRPALAKCHPHSSAQSQEPEGETRQVLTAAHPSTISTCSDVD